MRPVPIDETEVPLGARRLIVAPPDGDLTNDEIRPVEAVVFSHPSGQRLFAMKVRLDPGDLEHQRQDHPAPH